MKGLLVYLFDFLLILGVVLIWADAIDGVSHIGYLQAQIMALCAIFACLLYRLKKNNR